MSTNLGLFVYLTVCKGTYFEIWGPAGTKKKKEEKKKSPASMVIKLGDAAPGPACSLGHSTSLSCQDGIIVEGGSP